RRRYGIVPRDTGDFLDEIGGPFGVTPPRGDGHFVAAELEAEAFEDHALASLRDVDPSQRFGPPEVEGDRSSLDRRLPCANHLGCFASADVDDQPGEDRQPIVEKRRIDAALEPAARLAGAAELLSGPRDMLRFEKSDLEDHIGRIGTDARMLAAHDSADVMDLVGVGDHAHRGIEDIFLLVEREHLLALAGTPRPEMAVKLREI